MGRTRNNGPNPHLWRMFYGVNLQESGEAKHNLQPPLYGLRAGIPTVYHVPFLP